MAKNQTPILGHAKPFFYKTHQLSEGPVCNPNNLAEVAFVDINKGDFHFYDLGSNKIVRSLNFQKAHPIFKHASAIQPKQGGGWVIVGTHGVGILDSQFRLDMKSIVVLEDNPDLRFNDCQVIGDQLWGGTIDCVYFRNPSAAFGRLAPDGFHKVQEEHIVSNGLACTQDGKFVYHVESTDPMIWVYDRDPETTLLSNRRPAFRMVGQAEFPNALGDGVALCSFLGKETLAIAEWGLGRVTLYDLPEGNVLGHIITPVSRPTSLVFAGPAYDEVFITSEADPSKECALSRIKVSGLHGYPPRLVKWS